MIALAALPITVKRAVETVISYTMLRVFIGSLTFILKKEARVLVRLHFFS